MELKLGIGSRIYYEPTGYVSTQETTTDAKYKFHNSTEMNVQDLLN